MRRSCLIHFCLTLLLTSHFFSSLLPSLLPSSYQGLLHALLAVLHPPSSSSSSSLPPFRRRTGKPGAEEEEDEDEEEEEVDPALVYSNAAGFVHVTGREEGREGGREAEMKAASQRSGHRQVDPACSHPFLPSSFYRRTNRRGSGAEEVSVFGAVSGGVAMPILGGRECGVGGGGNVRGEED